MKEESSGAEALHITEALHTIAVAEEHRAEINLKAYKGNGEVVTYEGWVVMHDYWRKGYMRLRNPRNGQVRLVPQIFITELNGKRIYL